MKSKPVIGLVQGDPAGIGSELMVKLLIDNSVRDRADIAIIGAPSVIERGVAEVSAAGGKSSLDGLKLAFGLSKSGLIDGICFMPFNKGSMHMGGNPFLDEIGFARDYFGIDTAASEFNIAHGMWNGRVTSHVAMKDVAGMLSEERICQSIELADSTLKLAGYDRPRIVVAAYNPHAGDGGLMGREEIDFIQPAVKRMQERQMDVSGPFPADTLWLKVRDGEYDVVVTMYHDQGQIAIKLLGFDQGVSLLAGLPVPVTTPAHGTAFDIAGRNQANLDPARNAFMMCCDLADGLSNSKGWYRSTAESTYEPHGNHVIAGVAVQGDEQFESEPATGTAESYSVGRVSDVEKAVSAAEQAFLSYGYSERRARAEFLNSVADEIDARGDAITDIGTRETGLPEARLQGERGRTCGQLRLFADHISSDAYLDKRHQPALPDRTPIPGPEHKLVQRPIGPVAVFGASNFPLAFSTAGGDTAAALAAGCPVVVKGHSAHPGTSEVVADAVTAAVKKHSLDPGVFSLIQGGNRDMGTALVQHPLIKAVGFTGSLEEPIPFFGELGSVNPMFMLPAALQNRASEIGAGWVASVSMGAGQFCTNPGIAIGFENTLDEFVKAATEAFGSQGEQMMLTNGIAQSYQQGVDTFTSCDGVNTGRSATPVLCRTSADVWLKQASLHEEVFGPLGLLLEVKNEEQMLAIANKLEGQLTCTVQMDSSDTEQARSLIPVLERKAGRILVNGFPTGVEVSDAMVHGGPYPASTNFGATSVGTLSIRRFLRPVCYQNVPDELVPDWMV